MVIEFVCAALMPGSAQVIKSTAPGPAPTAAASRSPAHERRTGRAGAGQAGMDLGVAVARPGAGPFDRR
jgi:hypothetical protein